MKNKKSLNCVLLGLTFLSLSAWADCNSLKKGGLLGSYGPSGSEMAGPLCEGFAMAMKGGGCDQNFSGLGPYSKEMEWKAYTSCKMVEGAFSHRCEDMTYWGVADECRTLEYAFQNAFKKNSNVDMRAHTYGSVYRYPSNFENITGLYEGVLMAAQEEGCLSLYSSFHAQGSFFWNAVICHAVQETVFTGYKETFINKLTGAKKKLFKKWHKEKVAYYNGYLPLDKKIMASYQSYLHKDYEFQQSYAQWKKFQDEAAKPKTVPPSCPPKNSNVAPEVVDALTAAYALLGCGRTDSKSEVKKCFNLLALKVHPDKAKQNGLTVEVATEKFRELKSAFDKVLPYHKE